MKGFDAYGVEPDEEAALAASDVVPDVRAVGVTSHLGVLPADSLGAVVLSGCVETMSVASLRALVGLAAAKLMPGGSLVVLSAHPAAWLRAAPPWRSIWPRAARSTPRRGSRSSGRPVSSIPRCAWEPGRRWSNWRQPRPVRRVRRVRPVRRVRECGAGALGALAEVCATNFARLAGAVFVPADFALRARLPR